MASPFLIWPLVARSVEEQWSATATIRRLCREFGFEHAVFHVGSVGAIERLIVNVGRASWHQFSALPPRYESCEGERGAPLIGSSGARRSLFSPLFFALHPYLLCTHICSAPMALKCFQPQILAVICSAKTFIPWSISVTWFGNFFRPLAVKTHTESFE